MLPGVAVFSLKIGSLVRGAVAALGLGGLEAPGHIGRLRIIVMPDTTLRCGLRGRIGVGKVRATVVRPLSRAAVVGWVIVVFLFRRVVASIIVVSGGGNTLASQRSIVSSSGTGKGCLVVRESACLS